MKRKFTFLIAAALMLLTMMATTGRMWGQSRTETTTTYTFTSKSWTATSGGLAANWTSGQDGGGFANNGIQVTTNSTGANGTSPVSFTNVTKVVATYNTNKSAGAGSIVAQIGSNTATTNSVAYPGSGDGRTGYYTTEFDYTTAQTGNVKITVNTTTNSIYLVSVAITTNDGTTPSISASNVEIAYDDEEGSIAYTLNNATGNVTAEVTSGDWLELGTVTEDEVPFTCSANDGAAARTAQVTLSFAGASNKVVTITQAGNPNAPGTQNNPYTVAQARAAIDAGTGTQGVYATGIVSEIVTAYGTGGYNNVTFNIVDEAGDEVFLQAFRCVGDDAPNVLVGDIAVVTGNLTKYGTTYEFAQGCQVVSLEHPTVTVEAPTFSPAAGTYATAQTVTMSCTTDGAAIHYTTDGTEPDGNSNVYSTGITVSETTTFKAKAIKGDDASAVITATYHICSAENPYTVAQALAFHEYPTSTIWVHGIVSTAPTAAPNNGQLTYYISDNGEATNQLQVYKGKGLDNAAFTAQDDIQVGDIVTITGVVKIYNTTTEFDAGNYLTSFERPAPPVVPTITVDPDLIEAPATPVAPATAITGSLTVTLSNITITELDQLGVDFCDENGTLLTGANTKPSWFESTFELVGEEYKLNYTIAANTETTERVAYFKVYEVDSEVYSNKVTVTQEAYVAPTAIITVNPDLVEATAAEAEGNLGITLENITISQVDGHFEVYFCDENGTIITEGKPNWLTGEVQLENNVFSLYYMIDENTTSEARTAYMKVYGLSDDGNTEAYSNKITFTQAGATGPVTTGTIVFGNNGTKINATSVTGDDSMGNIWTVTTVGTTSFTQNNAYSQVGKSTEPATSITFTTTLPQQKTISAFEAKFGGFNGTVGDIALTVGNTTVGSGSLNGSTDVTVDATTTTEVGTVLTVTVTNIDKGVKCYYISYTLSDAPVVPVINPTANTIAYNATTGSIDYTIDNYEAGTMTAASEADWISNIDVEEADEMGEVTFNVTANESSASRSATVTLTFTYGDPAATVTKDVTVTQNGQPSITVSPATANVAFAGGTPEFAVTYESLEITGADDFDVEFYETAASTTAGDQPEWITNAAITGNTTDGFTLTVTVAANDGDAREAYLKLYAAGNSDFIYSNLVTISQAAYSQLATYTIVTSIDDLTPGYHYYIAGLNGENWFAMGGQNNNNRSAIAVNVTNNKISETANVCEFVISVDNNGLYTIYDELVTEKTPGYLYAPSGNSNYLKTQTTNTNNGIWTISINNETHVATIKANISSDKYMRYNSGSTIFSCYSSNTSQKDIYLFKKDNDVNIAYYGVEITYTEPNIPVGETITVGNGSVMTVPAAFTNTDPTSLIIEDGGQLVVSNPVAATMDKTYTKPSSWGNNSKGVNGWYLISSPVGTVNTSAVANLTPANSYDLYAYNEPDMMWYNAQGADHPFSQLVEGEGYLYSSKDGADAAYSGTVFCGSLTKTLSYEAANAEMKGWNLLGNPYSHNITWANLTPTGVNESGYYTLGFDGSWSAEPSTTAVIKPMQGFLVQATSAGAKVVFNNIAASAKARSNNDFIAFTVANGQYEDVTYAMFEEGLGLNKINHRNSDIPMVYIPQNGQNYAIATMGDETQSFNLNFKAMTTGKYTLSYKAEGKYDYLHVIDRITGEDVDMLLDGEYSFMASAGDNDARFIVKLRYDANGNFDSDIFAYQNGNDVIVNGEGELQMFDLTGRMVANTMVNGVQTVNVPTQGVYIFRLVGNDVKTQKIVVR